MVNAADTETEAQNAKESTQNKVTKISKSRIDQFVKQLRSRRATTQQYGVRGTILRCKVA